MRTFLQLDRMARSLEESCASDPKLLTLGRSKSNGRVFTFTKDDGRIPGHALVGSWRLWERSVSSGLSRGRHRPSWRLIRFWSLSAHHGVRVGPCVGRSLQPGGNRWSVHLASFPREGCHSLYRCTGCWSYCRCGNPLCHCQWQSWIQCGCRLRSEWLRRVFPWQLLVNRCAGC